MGSRHIRHPLFVNVVQYTVYLDIFAAFFQIFDYDSGQKLSEERNDPKGQSRVSYFSHS